MTKNKNIAGSSDSKIKALEAKMNKNIAGGVTIQTDLFFHLVFCAIILKDFLDCLACCPLVVWRSATGD
jgi:hypothetical protein